MAVQTTPLWVIGIPFLDWFKSKSRTLKQKVKVQKEQIEHLIRHFMSVVTVKTPALLKVLT